MALNETERPRHVVGFRGGFLRDRRVDGGAGCGREVAVREGIVLEDNYP